MLKREEEEYGRIHFEETELRLGLPGGCSSNNNHHEAADVTAGKNNAKRGFAETENEAATTPTTIDLKLNLTMSTSSSSTTINEEKTSLGDDHKLKDKVSSAKAPPSKAQVVGWPPVRSFRKNIVTAQKKVEDTTADQKVANTSATIAAAAFVKVSMDGAPYLRKVDLKLYKSYQDLSNALGKMFSSFTIGNCGSEGMKDLMNESKLIDLLNGSEYVATYEDKDGDWMLVGDVPWGMFVNSCKRLRIMKGSEAIGLAPRAVEKCKSRI